MHFMKLIKGWFFIGLALVVLGVFNWLVHQQIDRQPVSTTPTDQAVTPSNPVTPAATDSEPDVPSQPTEDGIVTASPEDPEKLPEPSPDLLPETTSFSPPEQPEEDVPSISPADAQPPQEVVSSETVEPGEAIETAEVEPVLLSPTIPEEQKPQAGSPYCPLTRIAGTVATSTYSPDYVELTVPAGTSLHTISSGTVVKHHVSPYSRNTIYIVDEQNRYCFVYGGLSDLASAPQEGVAVQCGDQLGLTPATTGGGTTTIHFSVLAIREGSQWWEHVRIDPTPFLGTGANPG